MLEDRSIIKGTKKTIHFSGFSPYCFICHLLLSVKHMKVIVLSTIILAITFCCPTAMADEVIDPNLASYFNEFQNVHFEQEKWRIGKPQRFILLSSFLREHQPIGKSHDDVCTLLGKPEFSKNSTERYCLQSGPVCGWVSIPYLELEYKDGILMRIRIFSENTGPKSIQKSVSPWISENVKKTKSY